jgi:hypothetical protein
MATKEQIHDYLDEHLPYMLKMLRYTHAQLHQPQHYLMWNAHFESFAVHARNLVNFLANKDDGNFKAKEFSDGFKAKTGNTIGNLIRLLDQQVFHLGKQRPREKVGKFKSDNAEPVKEWIETSFAEFLECLSEDLRKQFNEEKSRPEADAALVLSVAPGIAPSACTASFFTSSSLGRNNYNQGYTGSSGPSHPPCIIKGAVSDASESTEPREAGSYGDGPKRD